MVACKVVLGTREGVHHHAFTHNHQVVAWLHLHVFLVVEQFDADLLFAYKAQQALFDQLEVRFLGINELLLLQLTRDERIPLFVLGCTQFHKLLECLQCHEMVHC